MRRRSERSWQSKASKVPKKAQSETFDSNTITPGTPFMHRLSVALQYYIHLRLNNDPGWRNIMVILSDANVPGEGEHKVMAYIREQRGRPDWNPNTRHCLYGLDADLIMLALATHEPRFIILREVVFQQAAPNKEDQAAAIRAALTARNDPAAPLPVEHTKADKEEIARKPYQFLLVNVLREYLAFEMRTPVPFPWDEERIFDDFVFMCFFVGNDFLPHMPTLEIREGAIELLMHTYKHNLASLGGYLVDGCQANLERVERFIALVGVLEDQIFQKRMRLLKRDKQRRERDRMAGQHQFQRDGPGPNGLHQPQQRGPGKWSAAAPSAAYMAALAPVRPGAGAKGPVLLAPVGPSLPPPIPFTLGSPSGGAPQSVTPAAAPGGLPGPTAASGPTTNKSAALLLKERMLTGIKRKSEEPMQSDVSTSGLTVKVESDMSVTDNGTPDQATSTTGTTPRKARKLSLPEPKQEPSATMTNGAHDGPGELEDGMGSQSMEDAEGKTEDGLECKPMDMDQGPGPPFKTEHMEKATEKLYISGTDESSTAWRAGICVDVQVEGSEGDGIKSEGVSVKIEERIEGVQRGTVPGTDVPQPAQFWQELESLSAQTGGAGSAVEGAGEETGADEETETDGFVVPDDEDLPEEILTGAALAAAQAESKAAQEKFADALKARSKEAADMFDEMVVHEERIRLGEPGWKGRYYEEKTGLPPGPQQTAVVRDMVAKYVEGLCWVLRYYYDGVASWNWYYPYHYAPFASDLVGLGQMTITFDLGDPFKPFNQLMGVLPAASAHALPREYQKLFTEPASPILDFYPTDFKVDMNGKRFAWQGVALLPFIDEARLLAATTPLEATLNEEESRRNSTRIDLIYMLSSHPVAPDIFEMADAASGAQPDQLASVARPLSASLSGGMSGFLVPPAGDPCPLLMPAPFDLGEDIPHNAVVTACYKFPEHQAHVCRPLPGQLLEERKVKETDLQAPKPLWHEDTRGGPRRGLGPYSGFGGGGGGSFQDTLSQAAQRVLQHSLQAVQSRLGMQARPSYNSAPSPYQANGALPPPVMQYRPPAGLNPQPAAYSHRPQYNTRPPAQYGAPRQPYGTGYPAPVQQPYQSLQPPRAPQQYGVPQAAVHPAAGAQPYGITPQAAPSYGGRPQNLQYGAPAAPVPQQYGVPAGNLQYGAPAAQAPQQPSGAPQQYGVPQGYIRPTPPQQYGVPPAYQAAQATQQYGVPAHRQQYGVPQGYAGGRQGDGGAAYGYGSGGRGGYAGGRAAYGDPRGGRASAPNQSQSYGGATSNNPYAPLVRGPGNRRDPRRQ
eukprot:jgi/Botrbrau1/9419/Bobra.0252s0043.1